MLTMYKWDDPALKQIWQKLYALVHYLWLGRPSPIFVLD